MRVLTFLSRLAVAALATVVLVGALPGVAHPNSPLSNDPSPLAVCQDTIRVATLDLANQTRRGVGACLTRGIECLVGDAVGEAACCAKAAGRCEKDFAKIEKARARFAIYLANRRCAVVPFDAILNDLGYASLAERCAAGDPESSIADLNDLIQCLARLTVAETTCLIGAGELPQARTALECLDLTAAFTTLTGTDLATCAARGPAPSPSATVLRTATPTPIATILPSRTATIVVTATPQSATPTTIAITSTPTRIVTATPVPTTTATPGVAVTPTRTATVVPVVTATTTDGPHPTVTSTPVVTATATRTATPVPTVTATPGGSLCGDGNKDAGEDCDDGNTLDCDACPSDCKNAPADCTPIGTPPNTTRAPQKVTLHLTNGEPLTSALFCLRYPAGTVGLPGTGAVPQRISGFQGQTSLNDFNNSAKIALLGRTALTDVSLTVSFDLCNGATAPPPTSFDCAAISASNAGNSIDPAIVQCTAVAP